MVYTHRYKSRTLMHKYADSHISHIFNNIYISDYTKACDITDLKSADIGAVLFLGCKNKPLEILESYTANHIDHKFIGITDTKNSDLKKCYNPSWKYINDHITNNTNILVHCNRGISRSPSIVAYYLLRMIHKCASEHIEQPMLLDIMSLIHKHRPCINPNPGFMYQLQEYEQHLIET
jgi:protein tyrosine phosphatase